MFQILKKASLAAGVVQLKYFHSNLKITQKTSQHNIVTKVDYKCQEIIAKILISQLSKKGIDNNEIGFIGEENLNKAGKYLFVIDPLDGTSNYVSHYPYFCTSIAVFENQIQQYGFIYNPINKDIYFAQKGKGAYKINGKKKTKLKINHNFKNVLMSCHLSSNEKVRNNILNFIPKIFPFIRSNREIGSFALEACQYCENIFGIIVNGHVKIWDIAAVKLIIEEAGGNLYNWQGKPVEYQFNQPKKSYPVIACNKFYLEKIKKILHS